MSSWSDGYVSDVAYTHGYYTELNPVRAGFTLAAAGWVAPDKVGAACELGFGQGVSLNAHAAAGSAQWFGTDFNPAQAAFAQELASVAGRGNCAISDAAFSDFCVRSDLPNFDYIGLHGIWSWISNENRAVIVDFIRRKLKVGGVLYISYNTMPGWAGMLPIRHLLTQHAAVMGVAGQGIASQIGSALDFAERLLSTNPLYARQYPWVADRIKKMKEQNRNYLAHEYFNRDWHPMPLSRLGEWLEPAKVQYVTSANLTDHVDAINCTTDQIKFLAEIPDHMFREQVRDFMTNAQFRRDYWVKGARRLNLSERLEKLRNTRFVLQVPVADIEFKVTGALGEAALTEAIYRPVLDLLSDHKPHTLAQMESARVGGNLSQVMQVAMLLIGKGYISPTQDDEDIAQARQSVWRLNDHLANKARSAGEVGVHASPVTGGGVNIPRFHQLFLSALAQGNETNEQLAESVNTVLEVQGQRLLKDGKPIPERVENIAELARQAKEFMVKNLPVYRALELTP